MKNKTPGKKDLLVFGYGLAVIISFIAFKSWRAQNIPIASGLVVLAVIFLAVTILKCERLKGFYLRWMTVARFIGRPINIIIFIVIYYAVFGIIGIILRVLGKDLLNVRWGSPSRSYWKKREEQGENIQRYRQQF